MLPEDRSAFLRFVQENDPVTVAMRSANSAKVEVVADLEAAAGQTLCLWNRRILPHLERKWIREPGYYRVDELSTPTLEFIPSFEATWEGKPALGQGRLYGVFDPYLQKPPEFEKWYETLVRWIRKNYHRNPVAADGYVGPGAYEFYEKGGYLLPNFVPPRTQEWLTEIHKRHSRPAGPTRVPKRKLA
jgi:hypothetical protein